MNNNSLLENLNNVQKEAVQHKDGPLLILSGAGSGKTRIITHRIGYLIQKHQVSPYRIFAVTFTNKAANEMKERLESLLGSNVGESLWVSTFHSACAKILRRDISRLQNEEYDQQFAIYDMNEQRTIIRDIYKQLALSEKEFPSAVLLDAISKIKNKYIEPNTYIMTATYYRDKVIGQVYKLYQESLKQNNALDFDDLQILTVRLFREDPEILNYYKNKCQYVLVDEYQDINNVQYDLVQLLAKEHQNICVVGDDDQSIYAFRGSDISNILNFENDYENVTTLRLEQNYRSTQNILNAAWNVVKNNKGRKEKRLWTQNPEGSPLTYYEAIDDRDEAGFVGSKIQELAEKGLSYSDISIFYRTNAQSLRFEEALRNGEIPYQIVGGLGFYDRKEIKDLLAYLKVICNASDSMNLRRIINTPTRGIGDTTVYKLLEYAEQNNISLAETLIKVALVPGLTKRSANKIGQFLRIFKGLSAKDTPLKVLKTIIERTNYVAILEKQDTIENRTRLENIDELINTITTFELDRENPTLSDYIENISLVTDNPTEEDDNEPKVTLMSLHRSKGLEFPYVFMVGLEEGFLPHGRSMDNENDVEEERRLCYVGLTRCMQELYLISAQMRRLGGNVQYRQKSRFLYEIPVDLIKETDRYKNIF